MIYCNLAGLMANKKVNISEVSKSTKISRTTLTSLYYNHLRGIQLDTANELCKYFNVNMDKLFMFSKYDIMIKGVDYYPKEIVENITCGASVKGTAIISLLVKYGGISRICDISAALVFTFGSSDASIDITLDYYDPSNGKEVQENTTFLRKVFEALDDVFKNYILYTIDHEIVNYYAKQVLNDVEWYTRISNNLW